jgi:phosphatidylserine/phosphatidylglycerophosphate/cardiolipin synthase-like enzyme
VIHRLPTLLFAALLLAFAPLQQPGARSLLHPPVFELVESAPIETTLDHPDVRNADVVWVEMIQSAAQSLDFAEFYASSSPNSKLEKVMAALETAAARGVKVRFLLDLKFTSTYPEMSTRLKAIPGLELRVLDRSNSTRGILHAKYFVVDGEEVFIGSQNFDWRSLEHIQELGVRVAQPDIAKAVNDVFTLDWALAAGQQLDPQSLAPQGYVFPARIGEGEAELKVTPVFSPKVLLPDPKLWELLKIVELIDNARETVRVQVMTYKTTGRDKLYFDTLEAPLRRAAARGVKVQLLCADWSKRKGTIEGLQSLEPLDGIEVRMTTIPQWSGGFIPFARVSHAKYMVIDGKRAWIGTSNWEREYFASNRNLGLIVEGKSVGAQLERIFASVWDSSYASPVDPCAHYEAPKIDDK